MNSIFHHTYLENAKRLSASIRKSESQAGAVKGEGKEFSRVLSDIEAENKKTREGQQLKAEVASPQGNVGTLSNLDSEETKRLRNQIPSVVESAEGITKRGVNLAGKLEVSVNVPESAVKKLTPPPPTLPPPTPELLSAKRIPATSGYAKIPLNDIQLKRIISHAGGHHGVDPTLSIAIAAAESSLRPHAISRDGHATKGLFQLLDQTGKEMRASLGLSEAYNPFDAKQNAHLGVGYLRKLHDIFSKETVLHSKLRTYPASSAADLEKLAIAAFNAGEGNVATAQAKAVKLGKDPSKFESVEPHLPSSTRAYVTRVSNLRVAFSREDSVNKIV